MRIKRVICIALALLVCLSCISGMAKVVSPEASFYSLDQANVLRESTEGEIFFSNQMLEDACGAQIVIVAIDSTGNIPIDEYAYELFNDWEIGDKRKQNGFLLLMAIDDEDYYALTGAGIDIKFSSGSVGQYLDKYLEPDFAVGQYDAGVKKFYEAVFDRIAGIYNVSVTAADGIAAYEAYRTPGYAGNPMLRNFNNTGRQYRNFFSGSGKLLAILIFAILLAIISSKRRKARNQYRQQHVYHQPYNHQTRRGPDMGTLLFLNSLFRNTSNSHRGGFHGGENFGGFGRSGHNSSFGRSSGFAGRTGGFRGRPGGFGSAKGGGGGTRGGGAGRGRR